MRVRVRVCLHEWTDKYVKYFPDILIWDVERLQSASLNYNNNNNIIIIITQSYLTFVNLEDRLHFL